VTTVFFDSGVSLDGFLAGENRGPTNPLGDHGPTIHQWMYQQKAFWRHLGQEGGKEGKVCDGREVRVEFVERPGGVLVQERFDPESENPPELQRQGWQAILDNFRWYAEGKG
jgi:hypothetical protein